MRPEHENVAADAGYEPPQISDLPTDGPSTVCAMVQQQSPPLEL